MRGYFGARAGGPGVAGGVVTAIAMVGIWAGGEAVLITLGIRSWLLVLVPIACSVSFAALDARIKSQYSMTSIFVIAFASLTNVLLAYAVFRLFW